MAGMWQDKSIFPKSIDMIIKGLVADRAKQSVLQSLEHWSDKWGVPGSNPSRVWGTVSCLSVSLVFWNIFQ